MARDRIVSGDVQPEDLGPRGEGEGAGDRDGAHFNWSHRPEHLGEYVGQRGLVAKLEISIAAAQRRGDPHEHTLFHGPPGLGKTTLAHIIAREFNSHLVATSGPALTHAGDLLGILTNLDAGDVLFVDEIHRLGKAVEEYLYPAMEDFRVDFTVDKGTFAKTINVPLKPFTLIGATTRAGMLSEPLRNRFGITHHLDFYPVEDLVHIITRTARLLETPLEPEAAVLIAGRSRGTPRIANRLFRRVRDYADVKADGRVTPKVAEKALTLEGIDPRGLDPLDRRFLAVIINGYNGGPVGIEALAATLNEEADTLMDMVEPYLLKINFLARTKSGRRATDLAVTHLQTHGNDDERPTLPNRPGLF